MGATDNEKVSAWMDTEGRCLMEYVDWIVKHFGVSHFNAGLMVLMLYMLYRWFKSLIAAVERQGSAIATIETNIQLGRQWQEHHEEEDNRRFEEVQRRMI